MKRRFTAALITCLSVSAFAAGQPSTEESIRRIQDGLVPPVLVRGESPHMPSRSNRMAELNGAGVSIVVIHNGQLSPDGRIEAAWLWRK